MSYRANIHLAGPMQYRRAIGILRKGGVVALPTETVYGLAADAFNDKAVARIYALKGRPSHNPLIAHVLSPAQAHELAVVSPAAQSLIDAFWPGPLTLVLPRRPSRLAPQAGGWLPQVALRCAHAPWREKLLSGGWTSPLFMPSANVSGHISPTTAQHVADDFGDAVELILDGGACSGGIESTVLAVEDDHCVLLRPGALPAAALIPFAPDIRAPAPASSTGPAQPSAPGMLASHYAPQASVRLNATHARAHEVLLGFGSVVTGDLNLSPRGDLLEAARNLYSHLRALDELQKNTPEKTSIAVAPIPDTGVGRAINDRLSRAAAERK